MKEGEYVFWGHGVATATPLVADPEEQYDPAGQAKGVDDPSGQYVPAGHATLVEGD